MNDVEIIQPPKSMAERVRIRPAVIFGSAGIEGCLHVISEIIKNSIEEVKKGFGDRIIINRYEDNLLEVIDFGRGIPVEYNDKAKKFNWDINFCQMDSVAFFEEEKHEYKFSLGLDECELFFAQAVSEFMEAEICRDGCKYSLNFEKGENIGGLKKEPLGAKSTGTRIKFKLDDQVFDETRIDFDRLDEVIDKLSTCNTGILFELHYQQEGKGEINKEYYYNTIADKIRTINKFDMSNIYERTMKFSGENRPNRFCQGSVNVAMAYVGDEAIRESYFNHRFLKYGGIAVEQTEKLIKEGLKKKLDQSYIVEDDILEKMVKYFSIITCVKMVPENAVMWTNGTRSAIENPIVGKTVANEFVDSVDKMIEASLSRIKNDMEERFLGRTNGQ